MKENEISVKDSVGWFVTTNDESYGYNPTLSFDIDKNLLKNCHAPSTFMVWIGDESIDFMSENFSSEEKEVCVLHIPAHKLSFKQFKEFIGYCCNFSQIPMPAEHSMYLVWLKARYNHSQNSLGIQTAIINAESRSLNP